MDPINIPPVMLAYMPYMDPMDPMGYTIGMAEISTKSVGSPVTLVGL